MLTCFKYSFIPTVQLKIQLIYVGQSPCSTVSLTLLKGLTSFFNPNEHTKTCFKEYHETTME